MIGSSLYFIALLATAELEISECLIPETASTIANQAIDHTMAPEEEEEKVTTVTITNGIEPSMLSYKHWTGTYSPDVFTLSINDTTIEQGQTYTLTDATKPVVIRFDYSFMNGMRKGTKTVSYTMIDNTPTATITFSWLETHKVLLDNATISANKAT